MSETIESAQEFIRAAGLRGWLTRDYRYTNPVFLAALGTHVENLTRPVWLYIPGDGDPVVIAHEVDAGRFPSGSPRISRYSNRASMLAALREALPDSGAVAMEYSPMYELPRVGRVDAGTVELVRSLGPEVVSSGDIIQHATERWSDKQLASHLSAVDSLHRIVNDAFEFIGENVRWKLTEHDVAEFIRGRFDRAGLTTADGPVVAFEEHSSDPHYEPAPGSSAVIRRNGWLLIDLWARVDEEDSIYADITWTAHIGGPPTALQQEVFGVVANARDTGFRFLEDAVLEGRYPEGWEVDDVARRVISEAGYGDYFVHRLGHSLGREVHSNGVNFDGWETRDTRTVIEGVGVTIEPGIYLPEFGVRSEIDIFMAQDGPVITGEMQQEIIVIDTA